MKIARQRWIIASTPMNGTARIPAPSLRELLSAAKLRECRPMVAPGRWFIHRVLALKFLSGYVHRGTLPQSRIRSTAPSEREPGMGAHHSTCCPEAGTFRAIFIAPTELRMGYVPPFIGVHSLSLAFARQLPQRGSREGVRAIHRTARKPGRGGRFSSPLRNSEYFTFQRSSGVCCGYGISIQFNLNTKM